MADTPSNPPAAWHAMGPAQVVRCLDSDAARGLSSDAAALRRAQHGHNSLPEPARRSVLRVFLRQFRSPLIYILFAAAALAAAMGHWGDAGVIVAVVLTAFSAWRERASEPQLTRVLTWKARPLLM